MWHQIGRDHTQLTVIKQWGFCIYLTLMGVQIILFEGYSVSPVKVTAMSLSLLLIVLFGYFKNVTDALVWGVVNLVIMVACASWASPLIAWDRIGYRGMYIIMFVCVNNILYDGCISISFLKRILITLTLLYGIVFLIQHILFLLGIHQLPIINYYASITMSGVFKPNGLAAEPSHAARIMTVMYWGILKLTEMEMGKRLTIKDTLKIHPYCSALFLISMLTMGSATAIIGILLVLLYFFNRSIGIFIIAIIGFILMMTIKTDNSQLVRVQNIFNSLFSDDVASTLKMREGSGAVRIMPIINTFRMDFFSLETWIGQGSTTDASVSFLDRVFSSSRYIGDITSFGLLSYISSLLGT